MGRTFRHHLISLHENPLAITDFAHRGKTVFSRYANPKHCRNSFKDDSSCIGIRGLLDRSDIVERHLNKSGAPKGKSDACLWPPRRKGQSAPYFWKNAALAEDTYSEKSAMVFSLIADGFERELRIIEA